MELTSGDYFGARCIQVEADRFSVDADVRRGRLGFSLGVTLGRRGQAGRRYGRSMCLDVNAPMGEPHRLYLNGRKLHVAIGLWPGQGTQGWSWRRSEATRTWHWITVRPADWADRWARAHPAEVAAGKVRRKRRHTWWTIGSREPIPEAWWYKCPGRIARSSGEVNCTACGTLEPQPGGFNPARYWIAPWTGEQLAALAAVQAESESYVCRGGLHAERGEPPPALWPGERGWECPAEDCRYRQNWAFAEHDACGLAAAR